MLLTRGRPRCARPYLPTCTPPGGSSALLISLEKTTVFDQVEQEVPVEDE